jgi:amphi-Trp domain-containing protein
VTEFEREERVSRQRAAERLVDIAYALAGGGTLELRAGGAQVQVPVADDVLLKCSSRSDRDRVEVKVVLSWSA